jgi:MoaA/NifB/PqqE/SkfB family radical SAM enzyme
MSKASFSEYDRTRNFATKAFHSLCYAPYTSLYFDNKGDVRVCCHNFDAPAGNILQSSIDDIWNGALIKVLRDGLADYEFPKGCERCKWQTAEGNFSNLSMPAFDRFEVSDKQPQWPQQMEFSISTTCNLECIQCRGIFSSAIRAHREKLPPLPALYTDEILESFRKYLPHLKRMRFFGGEPFLIREHYRLWDMMIEDGIAPACHVTTNGTQYNKRVERILEHFPVSFAVSLDGATKWTMESIRVNADYDAVLRNMERFSAYARERGTTFSVTYCLMRQNWHEFAEFCLLADSWDAHVGVNTVIRPPEFGIYTLPREDLKRILDVLERQAAKLDAVFGKNRSVFFGELDRIRAKCSSRESVNA